jgi:hypothetical protein
MDSRVRQYLAEIGRRGGIRSRRKLTAEQARAMVARREGRRALKVFDRMSAALHLAEAPGFELVQAGLRDLAEGAVSNEALLVSIAAPRLTLLGMRVPSPATQPEAQLFDRLAAEYGDGAHAQYNALIRRLVSFARAVPLLQRAHARTR